MSHLRARGGGPVYFSVGEPSSPDCEDVSELASEGASGEDGN